MGAPDGATSVTKSSASKAPSTATTPLPTRAYADGDRFELTPQGEAYLAGHEPTPAA